MNRHHYRVLHGDYIRSIAEIHSPILPSAPARYVATLVVLVVGLIVTNILGFLHFRRQERSLDACIAAVDMDTPYLACKHAVQLVNGEPCPDWESLRLRNSVWRSLILAMLTFVLAARITLEIPACQAIASLSSGVVNIMPELTNRSSWVRDLNRDGISHREVEPRMKDIGDGAQQILQPHMRDQLRSRFAPEALTLEHDFWRAMHCGDSKWETRNAKSVWQSVVVSFGSL